MNDPEFMALLKIKQGTVLEQGEQNGLKYMIMRGPCSLCAYIGIPASSKLAGKDYNDIPLSVHGGLTFSHLGVENGDWPDPDLFWYGWDYGHLGDAAFYDARDGFIGYDETQWTVKMVSDEIWSATYDFSKLLKLVEG